MMENRTVAKRETSLDLLRILSMVMIVTMHIIGNGGLLAACEGGLNTAGIGLNLLNAICIVSVNCFVLISGYFLCESKFKLSRLIKLWVKVFVISAGIAMFFKLTGIVKESGADILKDFLPISYNRYWFMTKYFAMYLCAPMLNLLIAKADKKKHGAFIVMLVLLMSVWDDITPLVDAFGTNNGYSFGWFITLYLIAAYIRKYVSNDKVKKPALWYVGGVLFVFVFWIIITFIEGSHPSLEKYISARYFYGYNSLPILIAAVGLFLAFRKMQIKSKALIKITELAAPRTFGVYLIHAPLTMDVFLYQIVFPYASVTALTAFCAVGEAVVIFIGCALVDFVISWLIDLIVLKRDWFGKLMSKLDSKVAFLSEGRD